MDKLKSHFDRKGEVCVIKGIFMNHGFVYILSTRHNKMVYIGVTNDLKRRVYEHKSKEISGFTQKYNIDKLVYFERYEQIDRAIKREKEIKKWRREKKDNLIDSMNPDWMDLYDQL